MYNYTEKRIADRLKRIIESKLSQVGVLCRVFSRAKSSDSLEIKIQSSPGKYSELGKKIQDLYGVRVVLYFFDDNDVAQNAIKGLFEYDEESSTIDIPSADTFSATRCNLIFRLPDDMVGDSAVLSENNLVDSSFEVQLRTILSEGWHEVDHDLRYKCLEDWDGADDLSRALNGIYATLETSDWGMVKLFDDLSYRHYKDKSWGAMIRTKFRLRLSSLNPLSEKICDIFNSVDGVAKDIYRVDRIKLLTSILKNDMDIPMTLDNVVYLSNLLYVHNEDLIKLTPQPIINEIDNANIPGHLN